MDGKNEGQGEWLTLGHSKSAQGLGKRHGLTS